MTEKSKKQLVIEAQNEQLDVIATNRLTVLQSIDELESFGGKDDYVQGLRTIVNGYPDGITLSKVQTVLADTKVLADARKALKKEIEEIPKGKSFILKPRHTTNSEENAAA